MGVETMAVRLAWKTGLRAGVAFGLAVCGASGAVAQVSPPASQSATQSVQGVVVTAARPRETILIDRKVYSIANDLQAVTGTAADVLNQIPSVDVDGDGNISLRGDANVTILVDGKPSAQFSAGNRGAALQQFPAQDIDRIEVMTHPPAQYKAEGTAGVINIITKKSRGSGPTGTATLSLGDKRRFVASVAGDDKVGKLKLSGGVTVRQDYKERIDTDERTAIDPATGVAVDSHEDVDEHFLRLTPSVRLGADYAFNDRQSLSLSFNHREADAKHYFLQQDQSGPTGGAPDMASDRHNNGDEHEVSDSESLRFDQKFSRPDELLSISFQRSTYDSNYQYAYTNDYFLPVAPPGRDGLQETEDYTVLEGAVDFTVPLRHGRSLKLGYDVEDDSATLDNVGYTVDPATGRRINNPDISNRFLFHQQFNTAYAQYEAPYGKWTLQTGLRVEQLEVDDLLIIGQAVTTQSSLRAYPTLNLDRDLGKDGKLTFSLTRRVTWPSADQLNPFVERLDIYNLTAGNAALLPQDTWSYEIGNTGKFKALDYSLTAYYRFDRDRVSTITEPLGPDVTLTTAENLPKSKAAGLEFNGAGKFSPRLAYAVSGNLYYDDIEGGAWAVEGRRDAFAISAKASLDWKPTSADAAQISFSRKGGQLLAQGYVSATNQVNLGLRHTLWGGLAAVMTVTDVFDGQVYHRLIDTPTLQDDYSRHLLGAVGYLGLSYTFGLGRKAKPASFDYDTAQPTH
jgi:outer membrane receptor protein involved in Fe transport